jgi:FtsH-binding integral membrane protein
MALALAVTGLTAWWVATTPSVLQAIYSSRAVMWILLIAEFGLVFAISGAIQRISSSTARLLFFVYAVVNGLTLSFIFLVYTSTSIATTFFITAGTFALMSIFGYVTKSDLTRAGNMLFMVLIGVVLASLVNIFLKSSTLGWIITIAGIIVFVGLVAYDTQKIKQFAQAAYDSETGRKLAVIGALSLYLDFINLFLLLLNLFGGGRRN